VDVFKGAKTKKIVSSGFLDHPGYAKGKKFTKSDIERLARHLVLDGYLKENHSINPTFGGTTTYIAKGRRLAGQIMLSMADKMKPKSKRGNTKDEAANDAAANAKDPKFKELLDLLRRVRKTLSDILEKSATSVCPNKLLEHIATRKPTTLADLEKIEGFGSRRDKRFEWFAGAVRHVLAGKDPAVFDPRPSESPSQMQKAGRDGFGASYAEVSAPQLNSFRHNSAAPKKRAVTSSASPYFSMTSGPKRSTAVPKPPTGSASAPSHPKPLRQANVNWSDKTSARPQHRGGASKSISAGAAAALSDPVRGNRKKAPKKNSVF